MKKNTPDTPKIENGLLLFAYDIEQVFSWWGSIMNIEPWHKWNKERNLSTVWFEILQILLCSHSKTEGVLGGWMGGGGCWKKWGDGRKGGLGRKGEGGDKNGGREGERRRGGEKREGKGRKRREKGKGEWDPPVPPPQKVQRCGSLSDSSSSSIYYVSKQQRLWWDCAVCQCVTFLSLAGSTMSFQWNSLANFIKWEDNKKIPDIQLFMALA